MTAPKEIVASVLARLRNVAAESELSFNDILQAYVIERFLARLSQSPQVNTVYEKMWSKMKKDQDGMVDAKSMRMASEMMQDEATSKAGMSR